MTDISPVPAGAAAPGTAAGTGAGAGTAAAPGGAGGGVASSDALPPRTGAALLEQEGEIAADYLEALLDIADLDGDLDMDVEGERAVVSIVGSGLGKLVGPQGATLEALQELTRLAVQQQTGVRSRLMLDVGGHRQRRREELDALGRATAERVLQDGTAASLAAMTPFERKVVHDAVASVTGVRSESEGVEPDRHVVILPA